MNGLHPIFSECTRIGSPLDIERPFVIGPHVYATDSCICVRGPAGDRLPSASSSHIPPADRLDWPLAVPAGEPVPLPDVGNGRITCDECKGHGYFDSIDCYECDGEGWYGDPTPVDVGPIRLARKYIALLRRHGVWAVWPIGVASPVTLKARRQGERGRTIPAVYFTGDGYEGLLMGTKG